MGLPVNHAMGHKVKGHLKGPRFFSLILTTFVETCARDQILALSLANKLSSAKFLICYNFQSHSMLLRVSNSLDPGETLSYSESHPDPSCLHVAL